MSNTVASAKSIFLEALEIPTQLERQAYLDAHCGDDPNLRREVADLLRCHAGVGSFLDSPPTAIAQSADVLRESAKTPPSLSFLQPSTRAGSLGRLGSYEIEEVIGSGGMGIVLRALDDKLHRAVAIKVMAPALATNEHARRRFVREGRAAAAVRDDHVIGIHGVDEASGLPFLVMEYVVGRSLAQRLEAEGPLPLADILRIGGQIARGLAAAHSQGVVHRDIKPANILLENGIERVKITDFGLAHAVDDVRTTQPGTVVGTPEYMSPEQARGERVDHRSDLFSLGCVLYAMCAGRPPFRADSTVAIIRRVCEDTPRPLTEINADIPSWLAHLIDRLIAKAPDERFQTASEVAELLEHCLSHVQQPCGAGVPPAVSVASSQWPVAKRRGPRSRQWALSAAIVLMLGVGIALAETAGVTNLAATVIRIVRGDGTLVVEVDDPNIQVLVDGEELVINGAGPKEIRLRPGQHELQSVKDGKPVDTKLVTITRDGREVVKVARERTNLAPVGPSTRLVWADAAAPSGDVSPDGRYLAFTDWDTGDLAIRDLATGKNRRLTNKGPWSESSESAGSPKFSADSRQLAYTWIDKGGKVSLRTVGVEGGEPRVVYGCTNDTSLAAVYACGWAPDGQRIPATLYHAGEPGTSQLALISTVDGSARIIKSFNSRRRFDGWSALAPDGRSIAYSRNAEPESAHQDVFLIDVESGHETRITSHAADKRVIGWTPDGRHLLYDMQRQGTWDAWLIRIVRGNPQGEAQLAKKELGTVVPMGLTRDGTFYYASNARGPSLFTATLDLEKGAAFATSLAAEKFNFGDQLSLADWSPDGEQLAYLAQSRAIGQEMRILSLKTGQTRIVRPDLRILGRVRWSADGRSFIATSYAGRGSSSAEKRGIYQFNAVSGQATPVAISPPRAEDPVWSRDGRGIFYDKVVARKSSIVYRDLQSQTDRDFLTPGSAVNDLRNPISFEPSPDGGQIALLGYPNGRSMALWMVPLDGQPPRELLKVNCPRSRNEGLAWTPDGQHLLFTRQGGEENEQGLWYISANGGEPRRIALAGLDAKKISRIVVHPDGKQLALYASESGENEIWALENFLPPLNTNQSSEQKQANAAKKP